MTKKAKTFQMGAELLSIDHQFENKIYLYFFFTFVAVQKKQISEEDFNKFFVILLFARRSHFLLLVLLDYRCTAVEWPFLATLTDEATEILIFDLRQQPLQEDGQLGGLLEPVHTLSGQPEVKNTHTVRLWASGC